MSIADKQLFLCSCNGTAPIDAGALADALALEHTPPVRTMLCQKELAGFAEHAAGDVIVACTQEASRSASSTCAKQAAGRPKRAAQRRSSPRCSHRRRCRTPSRCRASAIDPQGRR